MGSMLAWILIFGAWLAVLSLILHDATKEDADGGAIRVAASNVRAAVSWAMKTWAKKPWAIKTCAIKTWAMLKARTFTAASSHAASQGHASKPPPKQRLALGKRNWWHKDHRISMTTPELELAIAEAVRKASPGCEDFVSVIVEHQTPKSRLDPDWSVRGVRFGKADRKKVDEALSTIVKRMQQEIRLGND
jgi:hypothetical protein